MSSSTLLLRLLLCWLLCTHRPPGRQSERSFKGWRDDGAAGGWIFQIPAFHKAHSIYNDRDIARDTSRHKTNFKTEKSSTATGTARKLLLLAMASRAGKHPALPGWEAAVGILCSPWRMLPETWERRRPQPAEHHLSTGKRSVWTGCPVEAAVAVFSLSASCFLCLGKCSSSCLELYPALAGNQPFPS